MIYEQNKIRMRPENYAVNDARPYTIDCGWLLGGWLLNISWKLHDSLAISRIMSKNNEWPYPISTRNQSPYGALSASSYNIMCGTSYLTSNDLAAVPPPMIIVFNAAFSISWISSNFEFINVGWHSMQNIAPKNGSWYSGQPHISISILGGWHLNVELRNELCHHQLVHCVPWALIHILTHVMCLVSPPMYGTRARATKLVVRSLWGVSARAGKCHRRWCYITLCKKNCLFVFSIPEPPWMESIFVPSSSLLPSSLFILLCIRGLDPWPLPINVFPSEVSLTYLFRA